MNWRAHEVNDDEEYRLHLCQASNGLRYFKLVVIGSEVDNSRSGDVVLATRVIPNGLLKARDMKAIVGTSFLENGQTFSVDAHRMWLTESEIHQMDSGMNFSEIRWATEHAPQFAPK